MSPRINSATVIPVGNKVGFLFSLFFVILLMALPAVTQAATPWYSHGKSHTLTLTQDGAVWALGDNSYGNLASVRMVATLVSRLWLKVLMA